MGVRRFDIQVGMKIAVGMQFGIDIQTVNFCLRVFHSKFDGREDMVIEFRKYDNNASPCVQIQTISSMNRHQTNGNLSVKDEGFKNEHKYDGISGSHFGANGCIGGLHVKFLVKFKHIIGKNEAGEFHNTVTPNDRKTMLAGSRREQPGRPHAGY